MIYIGSDHRGVALKQVVKNHLSDEGKAYSDVGTKSEEAVDFPDFGFRVAKKVSESNGTDIGILICGSGVGMNIVANKVQGVRATLATSVEIAAAARQDDDINVLVLGAQFTSDEEAREIVNAFLSTPFDTAERRVRRLDKITKYESQ